MAFYVDSSGSKDVQKDWEIRMLYDGDCPLCMREVNMLKKRDTNVGKIDFVDISSPEYEPEQNANISYEEVEFHLAFALPASTTLCMHNDEKCSYCFNLNYYTRSQ